MDYASIGITLEALGDDGTDLGTHRLGLLRTYLTWQAEARLPAAENHLADAA